NSRSFCLISLEAYLPRRLQRAKKRWEHLFSDSCNRNRNHPSHLQSECLLLRRGISGRILGLHLRSHLGMATLFSLPRRPKRQSFCQALSRQKIRLCSPAFSTCFGTATNCRRVVLRIQSWSLRLCCAAL